MNLRTLGPASLNAQLLGFKIAGIVGTSALARLERGVVLETHGYMN